MPALDQPILLMLTQLLLAAIPACALALLLRRTQVPGGPRAAAIIAGIVIGLLLGPGVAGQIRPDLVNPIYRGASDEQREVSDVVRDQQTALAALRHAGASPQTISETIAQNDAQRRPLQQSLRDARADHLARFMWLVITLVSVHILIAGVVKLPSNPAAFRALVRTLMNGHARALLTGTLIALLSLAPPTAIAALTGTTNPGDALAFGIIFAIPGISIALRPTDYLAAGSALLLCLIACVLAGFSLQMVAVGGAILVSGLIPTGFSAAAVRRLRRRLPHALDAFFLPTIVALSTLTLDIHALGASATFWVALLVAVIWSSDGRWMAAALAWRLTDRTAPRYDAWRRATRLLDAGAGIAQLFTAIVFIASGVLGPEILGAAIAGTAIVELSSGARQWLLGSITEQSPPPQA